MSKDRVYLYPGLGPGERHYLDQRGTVDDLERLGLQLSEGAIVSFWADDADDHDQPDDLIFEGRVHFDEGTGKWYAILDSDNFRHRSDLPRRK